MSIRSGYQEWLLDKNGHIQAWPINDYFHSGKRETQFLGHSVEKYHRTISQIFSALLQAGFQIDAVEEPQPPTHMMNIPGMIDELRRPMMLIIRAKKL